MARKAEKVIFIADDEPKVCETICETLQDSGVTAKCFTDPAQCLDRISSTGCDLLIADLKMPGMDGLALMRQAKLLVPWLPVVIITAYGDVPTAVKATHAGAVNFIEKPLAKDDFIRKVWSILQSTDGTPKRLTKTEASVLRLVALGKSNSEIAHFLHRSSRTVELHRNHAMNKLGLHDFTDLLRRIGGIGVAEFLAANERDGAAANPAEDGQ